MIVGIIGRVAFNKGLLDGQTVKTAVLYDELCKKYTEKEVFCVDTYNYKKNVIKVMFNFIICIIRCKHIFLVLSENGRKFFVPLIYFSNKILKRRVYHDVIGGVVYKDIEKNPKMLKYYNSFVVNWVELKSLKDKLSEMGLENVEVLPNIKRLVAVDDKVANRTTTFPLKLCTFSRVSKSKGILNAINSVARVNRKHDKKILVLDIYGPIENGFEEEFFSTLNNDFVNYCGMVDFDKSVQTLSLYDILLFPTFFQGEGFPGTIIDAFYSATPVICTDWHYNSEIIEYGKTGFYYDYKTPNKLDEYLDMIIQNIDILTDMRKNCLFESKKYDADKLMKIIFNKIEE